MKRNLLIITALITALSSNAQIDLENGLLAHYPFNGNANDVSGNGHHGVVNGATLTSDRFGNADGAYLFDGTGNWIDVNDLNQQLYGFTVAIWAKSTNAGSIGTILSKHSNSGDVTALIRMENGSHVAALNVGSTYMSMSGAPISTSDYDFLVLTYDGLVASFYVNNVAVSSTLMGGDPALNSYPWAFGRYAAGGGITEYYTGEIDDAKIYDRNLNLQEIEALYTEGTTSISESEQAVIQIYPNPANEQLTITSKKAENIVITDMCGNIVDTVFVSGTSIIATSQYPSGVYFVKSSEGNTKFVKF